MVLTRNCKLISRYKIWSCFLKINNFKIINEDEFHEIKLKLNSHEVQIEKDIIRTKYPNNFNKSQKEQYWKSLSNILRAYTNVNKDIGYIQGMNMIASAILFNMYNSQEEVKDIEYKTFKVFYCMLDKYNIAKIYKNKMDKIFKICEKLKDKIEKEINDLYIKLKNIGLDIFLLFGSFYFSILLQYLELESSYKIIDIFLIYGFEIISLLILWMVKIYKNKIMCLESHEEIIIFIRNDLVKLFFKNYNYHKNDIINELDLNKDFYNKITKN